MERGLVDEGDLWEVSVDSRNILNAESLAFWGCEFVRSNYINCDILDLSGLFVLLSVRCFPSKRVIRQNFQLLHLITGNLPEWVSIRLDFLIELKDLNITLWGSAGACNEESECNLEIIHILVLFFVAPISWSSTKLFFIKIMKITF